MEYMLSHVKLENQPEKSTMNVWSLAKWVQVLWKKAKGMDGVSLGMAIKDHMDYTYEKWE